MIPPRASSLSSEAEALELRLASVMDAERARLLSIGERHQQVGQLGVGAMRGDEAGDVVASVPAASLAADRERRMSDRVREPSRGMVVAAGLKLPASLELHQPQDRVAVALAGAAHGAHYGNL
jgi:hypothetical protein